MNFKILVTVTISTYVGRKGGATEVEAVNFEENRGNRGIEASGTSGNRGNRSGNRGIEASGIEAPEIEETGRRNRGNRGVRNECWLVPLQISASAWRPLTRSHCLAIRSVNTEHWLPRKVSSLFLYSLASRIYFILLWLSFS